MTLTKPLKRLASSVLAGLLLSTQLVAPVAASTDEMQTFGNNNNNQKVTICHRTGSYSNPYSSTPVDVSAVDGDNSNDHGQGDHYLEHLGPIFYPSIPQHTEWGDIIPPIAGVHSGYNWTTEGQQVWNNGCNLPPTGKLEVNKKVDTDGDGSYESGNTTANNIGFSWGFDNATPSRAMGTTASDVPVGAHTIQENSINGYVFTGWYYSDDIFKSCNNPRGTTMPVNVQVEKNKTKSITLCNQAKKGSITIIKDAQPNDDQNFYFEIDKRASLWDELFILDDDGNNSNLFKNTRTFNNLTLGTYDIDEAPLPGWKLTDLVCSQGADVVKDMQTRTVSITLHPGDSVTCTFVNQKEAKLKIVKDAQPNSSQNFAFTSDLGPFVLDDDHNPALSNNKQFSSLTPGTYSVNEQAVAGWSLQDVACVGTQSYTKDLASGQLQVDLQPGDDVTCTFTNLKHSSIEGQKFEDVNGNGTWDRGEPIIKDWPITLTKTGNGAFTQSVQTDATGTYHFDGLLPGTYTVCEEQKSGWTQTFPQTATGCYDVTIQNPGQELCELDFGNFEEGIVTGGKFNDRDGDGVWDADESGIKDWTISFYDQANGIPPLTNAAPLKTIQTDKDGMYSFEGLLPGVYSVCETPRNNWNRTYPATSDCHTFEITFSGQRITADFGNKFVPQVLGTNIVVGPTNAVSAPFVSPAQLVNTGTSLTKHLVVGLVILGIIGAAHFLTTRRKDYAAPRAS